MADAKQGALRGPNESWFGDPIQGLGCQIEKPITEAEVIKILTKRDLYPSPVRPVGSRHSMTECISAQAVRGAAERWGTLVDMTEFTQLGARPGEPADPSLRIDWNANPITVTVPAGRTFYEVAQELSRTAHGNVDGLQFRVNPELGTLTMGAAACGATKDSSFPDEFGQVCADVVGMRIVKPNGEVKEFKAGDREMEALRCSYGLFGIVTEVTFRVYPIEYISLNHVKFPLKKHDFTPDELRTQLDTWVRERNGVFLYLFPFRDRIVAELRRKPATGGEKEEKSVRLQVRNFFWKQGIHDYEDFVRGLYEKLPSETLQKKLQDGFDKVLAEFLSGVLRLCRVNPAAQIVNFDKDARASLRFTFSMWAFPEADFPEILPQYFKLCAKHEATYRSCLPHVSYHIAQDESSLLSYSRKGPVWTLDPICPDNDRNRGWQPFLAKFNEFCSDRGGVPLLNQTPYLERKHVVRAFGAELLAEFDAIRRQFDPEDRMLNDYFAKLLTA